MLADLYRYRRYIGQNAVREIRHRYAGTGLGLFWHVISPFMQILIYWAVFSTLMQQSVKGMDGIPGAYAVYVSAMLLPWVSFTEAISRGTGAFQENAAYLKRLPIPGHIFVATTVATSVIQLAISLTILIIFSSALGWHPTGTWLLLPVICLLLQGMGFGIGMVLGTLNIFFRDVAQFLIVFLQMWMWSIPIVYTEDTLAHGPLKRLLPWLPLNPPYVFFLSIRDVFVQKTLPPAWAWPMMVGWVVVFVGIGLLVCRSLQGEVRDVL